MGATVSSVFTGLFSSKSVRIMMVGINAAGKTTILYKLKLGEVVNTICTTGFNVETIRYKNISFTIWEVGSLSKTKSPWRHYAENTDGIIFVVDSTDKERIAEAKEDLNDMLRTEKSNCILLIFANKQDLPNAMSTAELTESLKLNELKNRKWHIQPCSATQGIGLYEGLDWLAKKLAGK